MARTPEQPPEVPSVPSWTAVGVIVGLAAAMVTGYVVVGRCWREASIEADRQRVHAAADDQAAASVRTLASWGEETLPEIVTLANDERPAVAAAARATLGDLVHQWRLLPAAEATPKIELLVRALAAHAGDWDDEGQRAAAEIAQQCLAWPLDGSGGAPTRVIASCETILRAATYHRQVAHTVYADEHPAHSPREESFGPREEPHASAAWDRLPPLVMDLPLDAPSSLPLSPADEPSGEPRLAEIAGPVAENFSPGGAILAPPQPLLSSPARPLPPPEGERSKSVTAPATSAADIRKRISELSAVNATVAAAAERALRQQGWSDFELAVARRATSPRVADRLRLCDELPGLPLDARPWLLLLSDDEDISVRDRARGILATSADANLRR